MSFSRAVNSGFSKYALTSGRASRAAYWYWGLFTLLFYSAALAFDLVLGTLGLLSVLSTLFLLFPSLAVAVRRLHDVNKTGWNYLWSFVPLVGAVYLFVLFVTEGTHGPNKYGPMTDG